VTHQLVTHQHDEPPPVDHLDVLKSRGKPTAALIQIASADVPWRT
jgi:hypothetical protein